MVVSRLIKTPVIASSEGLVRSCIRSAHFVSVSINVLGIVFLRLQRAKREGDLPKNADPAELASYVMTVVRGMAVQSASGASRDQLRRVAQIALRAWPKR
jgi:hypothetical protein